jgi:hypothetical protein
MKPGALHHARWMAKIIYSIKICLFRSQFQMTHREITGMQRFAAFSTIIYVRAWFQAPLAVAAPSNDLSLLKQLVRYEDPGISNAAVTAFSRHQWYFERNISFARILRSGYQCHGQERDDAGIN